MNYGSVPYLPQRAELTASGLPRVPVLKRWQDGTEAESHRNIGPDYPTYTLWLRLLKEGCPDIDLFDGFGNGSLHFVVRANYTAQYLELDFHPTDWENLFLETLHCLPYETCLPEETAEICHERNRRQFQASLSDYPLLSRIFDMYKETRYWREEVFLLRDECGHIQEKASHLGGIRALRKLIFACNVTVEAEGRLTLECD